MDVSDANSTKPFGTTDMLPFDKAVETIIKFLAFPKEAPTNFVDGFCNLNW